MAANSEALPPDLLDRFMAVSGRRKPPTKPVKTLAVVAGRGGGKTCAISAISIIEAINFNRDSIPFMMRGETAEIGYFAPSISQACIGLAYCRGYTQDVPAIERLVTRDLQESLTLSNGVVINAHGPSFRTARGTRLICAILDESTHFPNADDGNLLSAEIST